MKKVKQGLLKQAVIVLGLLTAAGHASAQNWQNRASMNQARVEATTVEYRGDIYVFNGFKAGLQLANSVEKYDAGTKQWSTIAGTTTMNDTAVTHNGVVRVGADVWIIGGRVGSHPGRVTDRVWIFNLNTRKWRPGPNLPIPGAAGGAALVNNKIHWFGGIDRNANCDVDTHVVYDLDKPGQGWKNNNASLPVPRNHFSTAVVNGIIYAMGGQFGHDACPGKNTDDTPLVHAFNPQTNQWSRKADMPNKNSHSEPGTFVYKGDIYTTGGENALNKVWKYNPRANKWSEFRTLPEGLVAPIARIIDGDLIVAGGGAPRAALAVNTVRSLRVDNNPPNPQPVPQPEPPAPGSNTPEGATLISMEAEYYDVISNTSTHQWVPAVIGNSSNDDAMITTPDEGQLAATTDNTPMLSYMVNFNYAGKHYVWIRGMGDTADNGVGNSDSIQVGLNGELSDDAYRIDTFPNEWTWSRHTPSAPAASLNVVNAGVNIVNLWMREDGLAIDKFVITSDPNFVPTGFGPELTDGSSDYVAPVTDEVDQNNDEPVVVEPPVQVDTTVETVEPIVSDMIDDDPMNTDSTNDVQVTDDEPDTNQAVSDIAVSSSSGDGLFGGSASLAALVALFAICLMRLGRTRAA